MTETGISVAVDVERLAERIAERVAGRLAGLFPDDATDFWVALVEQATAERQRVAAVASLTCTCPETTTRNALDGMILDGHDDNLLHGGITDDGDPPPAPLDPDPRH